jgi:hypothetical protein
MVNHVAFKLFAEQKGTEWPYKELHRTRSSFISRWLLFSSSKYHGVVYRPRGYFVLPTSTMPLDVVQHLIVSECCVPLPKDFCDVIDCMEWWGRIVSSRWEQEVMHLIYQYIQKDGFYDRAPTRYELFYGCIQLWVNMKLTMHYAGHMCIITDVTRVWAKHFDKIYPSDVNDFFTLAVKSMQFISNEIEAITNTNNYYVDDVQSD